MLSSPKQTNNCHVFECLVLVRVVGDAPVFVQLHGRAGHHTLLGVADRTELVSARIRLATLDIRLGRRLARRAHGTFRARQPGAGHGASGIDVRLFPFGPVFPIVAVALHDPVPSIAYILAAAAVAWSIPMLKNADWVGEKGISTNNGD